MGGDCGMSASHDSGDMNEAEDLLREAANAIKEIGTDYVLRGEDRPHGDLWMRIAKFLTGQNQRRN